MSGLSPSDRRFCENEALRPGTALALSFRFAPPRHADRILALNALFRMVRSIPVLVSDPSVALTKLAWWRKEIAQGSDMRAQHPVIRALCGSGALDRLDTGVLDDYFRQLSEFMTDGVVQDENELFRVAAGIGGLEALLECSDAKNMPSGAAMKLGSAIFVAQQFRHLGQASYSGSWWVPLDLQARFGSTLPVGSGPEIRDIPADMIRALGSRASGWLDQGRNELHESVPLEAHHLLIRSGIVAGQLKRLIRRPQRLLTNGGVPAPGILSAVYAWRTALSLNSGTRLGKSGKHENES